MSTNTIQPATNIEEAIADLAKKINTYADHYDAANAAKYEAEVVIHSLYLAKVPDATIAKRVTALLTKDFDWDKSAASRFLIQQFNLRTRAERSDKGATNTPAEVVEKLIEDAKALANGDAKAAKAALLAAYRAAK